MSRSPEHQNLHIDHDQAEAHTFSADGLRKYIRSVIDRIDTRCDEEVDYERTITIEQQETRALLDTLLQEAHQFTSVFRTSNGSMYFVLPTGESQRVKFGLLLDGKTQGYRVQPMMKHIVFIDPKHWPQVQDLIQHTAHEPHIKNFADIPTIATPHIGAIPFEYEQDTRASGMYHFGHPIVAFVP